MMTTATMNPLLLTADWRDFVALTKPRVMSLVVFTGLCGMLACWSNSGMAGCIPFQL